MKMNPAAAVLENDDPRVVVLVVVYASTSTSKGDLYSS